MKPKRETLWRRMVKWAGNADVNELPRCPVCGSVCQMSHGHKPIWGVKQRVFVPVNERVAMNESLVSVWDGTKYNVFRHTKRFICETHGTLYQRDSLNEEWEVCPRGKG